MDFPPLSRDSYIGDYKTLVLIEKKNYKSKTITSKINFIQEI
jgi:hypothetical protein